MEINSLVRDADRVKACLQETSSGSLIATKGCKIIIPARFSERGLAEIGLETFIIGVYAMIVEDKYYAVSLINMMIRITPTSTLKIKIKGVEYYEFTFDPGQIVMPRTNLVRNDILVYKIYDEIVSKGKVPWYLGYEDLGHIFDTALSHGGANIGTDAEVTELIISIISRNSKDRTQYYRSSINSIEDLKTNPPVFISLKSVPYAATNTTNKLAGSYWSEGVVSALVSPSDRVERVESLLLK
jgi:hypothetical protein